MIEEYPETTFAVVNGWAAAGAYSVSVAPEEIGYLAASRPDRQLSAAVGSQRRSPSAGFKLVPSQPMVRHDEHASVPDRAENGGCRRQSASWGEAGSQVMSHNDPEVLSVRARRAIFGVFGCLFVAVAILRMTYGDVLFPLFFAAFAAIAFTLRWMTGKWWAELSPPPRWQRR